MRIWLSLIVCCLVGLQPCAGQGQCSGVKARLKKLVSGIKAIETTAGSVKKLLGEPIRTSPDFYKFDDFNVLVSYTTGLPCEKEQSGWNVPRDRVNTFTIIITTAFHQKELKDFGIDLGKYEKDVDESGHSPETIYTNREEGTRIYLNGDQVTSIALFPAKKYLNLLCPRKERKDNQLRLGISTHSYHMPVSNANTSR
jgi:hypothetical protein